MLYGDFSNWSLPLSKACFSGVRARGLPFARTTGLMVQSLASEQAHIHPSTSFQIPVILDRRAPLQIGSCFLLIFFKCPSVSMLFFSFFDVHLYSSLKYFFYLLKKKENKQVSVNNTCIYIVGR